MFEIDTLWKNVMTCKILHYFWWLSFFNANTHLACLALDRAISIAFESWHYKKQWGIIIPRISLGITALKCFFSIPVCVFGNITAKGGCRIVSEQFEVALKVYKMLITVVYYILGPPFWVLISTVIFIHVLKKRRIIRNYRSSANTAKEWAILVEILYVWESHKH